MNSVPKLKDNASQNESHKMITRLRLRRENRIPPKWRFAPTNSWKEENDCTTMETLELLFLLL